MVQWFESVFKPSFSTMNRPMWGKNWWPKDSQHDTNNLGMTLDKTNWTDVISQRSISTNVPTCLCVDRKQAPLWFDTCSSLASCSEEVPTSHQTSVCSTSNVCLASCPLAHTATVLKACLSKSCPWSGVIQIEKPSLGVPSHCWTHSWWTLKDVIS